MPHSARTLPGAVPAGTQRTYLNAALRRLAPTAALVAALALLLVLSAQARRYREEIWRLRQRNIEPHAGSWLPMVTAPTPQGDSVRLADASVKRRQVLLYFTTTCPYCEAVRPRWDSLTAALQRESDVDVIRVALDSMPAVRSWTARVHPRQRTVVIEDIRTRALMRGNIVPYTVLTDASGRVRFSAGGTLDRAGLLDSLRAAITNRVE